MTKTIQTKQELCKMLSEVVEVSSLTVKELTAGTKNVEEVYNLTINKLALEILDTPTNKQQKLKQVFKNYNKTDENFTAKHLNYIGETFDIAKLNDKTDEEILNLLTRIENYKTSFAILYAMDSGYARNEQILRTFRWITQKAQMEIEAVAANRNLIKLDFEPFVF